MCVSKNVDENDQEDNQSYMNMKWSPTNSFTKLKVFNGQLYKMCKELKISLTKQTINREVSLFLSKPFKTTFGLNAYTVCSTHFLKP